MVAVWSGEWMEYYCSWSDTYDTNNFSWADGVIGLIIYGAIGVISLALWRFYSKNKQRLAHIFMQ